jgi:hypothetical protein
VAITPEIEAEIIREFRQTKSPFKVSNKVGVSVAEVFAVIENHEDKLTVVPERHGGEGRPEIRDSLIAKRKATEREWNNSDPKIVEARRNYEKGTHIMATGRDGAWLLLYSFKRIGRPDPLPDYFLPEVA